jgi:hypothetical protein
MMDKYYGIQTITMLKVFLYLVFDWSDCILSSPVDIVGICADVDGWFWLRWREDVLGEVCFVEICAVELKPFSLTL